LARQLWALEETTGIRIGSAIRLLRSPLFVFDGVQS